MTVNQAWERFNEVHDRLEELGLNDYDLEMIMDPNKREAPTWAFWRGEAVLITQDVPNCCPIVRLRYCNPIK